MQFLHERFEFLLSEFRLRLECFSLHFCFNGSMHIQKRSLSSISWLFFCRMQHKQHSQTAIFNANGKNLEMENSFLLFTIRFTSSIRYVQLNMGRYVVSPKSNESKPESVIESIACDNTDSLVDVWFLFIFGLVALLNVNCNPFGTW